MALCPLCLHDNPADAGVCQHCGRYRFADQFETELADDDSLTIQATKMPRLGEPNQPAASMPTLPVLPALNVPSTQETEKLPSPKLIVIRGQKLNAEYPLYQGPNYVGRTGDKPADIDLAGLEPVDQVWSSRQHAVIHNNRGTLVIEDLGSLNGTYVNRGKLSANKKYPLNVDDVIQIGTVQFRVTVS